MIPRYSRKEMARIWGEENKSASWLQVELAALTAMAECGLIPGKHRPGRAKAACDVDQILALEEKTHHDVAAFVDQVAACLGRTAAISTSGSLPRTYWIPPWPCA